MFRPLPLIILAKVPLKRLLAPRALARIRNRRIRRDRLVFGRILQEQGQSPVSTHTMPRYADTVRVQLLERREEGLGELFGDVAVHLVAFAPGLLCRVDVETGTGAEVVGIVFAFDF